MTTPDNKILIAIRGYEGWTSDLDAGMLAALRKGCLQSAYDSARARYFVGVGADARAVKVMPAAEQPAFIAIFRDELRKVLADAG